MGNPDLELDTPRISPIRGLDRSPCFLRARQIHEQITMIPRIPSTERGGRWDDDFADGLASVKPHQQCSQGQEEEEEEEKRKRKRHVDLTSQTQRKAPAHPH